MSQLLLEILSFQMLQTYVAINIASLHHIQKLTFPAKSNQNRRLTLQMKESIDGNASVNQKGKDLNNSNNRSQYQIQQLKQEITISIAKIKEKFPSLNLKSTLESLYRRFIVFKEKSNNFQALTSYSQNTVVHLKGSVDDPNKPKFQIRQIVPKAKLEDRDWLRQKPEWDEKQKLSKSVWDRYNQAIQDKMEKGNSTIPKPLSNEQNFKITAGWKFSPQNRSFRLYCNKVAPKFGSKDQQMKFYQKRLAAKAFCDRGYGLAQVEQDYFELTYKQYHSTPEAPLNRDSFPTLGELKPYKPKLSPYPYPDPRRYKTITNAFVADTLKKLQIFIMEKVDRRTRPFTGPEMKAIFAIMINAEHYFPQQEYITFRRFVKVTFDLGSANIYQNPSMSLYRSIQIHLTDRLSEARLENQSMASQYYGGGFSSENEKMQQYADSLCVLDLDEDLNIELLNEQFINHIALIIIFPSLGSKTNNSYTLYSAIQIKYQSTTLFYLLYFDMHLKRKMITKCRDYAFVFKNQKKRKTQRNCRVSFKPIKNNKKRQQTVSITPIFNNDNLYYTPAFCLPFEQVNRGSYLSQFEIKIFNATMEFEPFEYPQPAREKVYCNICQFLIQRDYVKHVQEQSHIAKVHQSKYTLKIQQLCKQFQKSRIRKETVSKVAGGSASSKPSQSPPQSKRNRVGIHTGF